MHSQCWWEMLLWTEEYYHRRRFQVVGWAMVDCHQWIWCHIRNACFWCFVSENILLAGLLKGLLIYANYIPIHVDRKYLDQASWIHGWMATHQCQKSVTSATTESSFIFEQHVEMRMGLILPFSWRLVIFSCNHLHNLLETSAITVQVETPAITAESQADCEEDVLLNFPIYFIFFKLQRVWMKWWCKDLTKKYCVLCNLFWWYFSKQTISSVYRCKSEESVFLSFCRRSHFMFKFPLFFSVLKHLILALKMLILGFETWLVA